MREHRTRTTWRDKLNAKIRRQPSKRMQALKESKKPTGVAAMVIGPHDTPMVPAEHLPPIEPAPKKRKARKPKAIPEIVHTIEGLPIKVGIDALKAELDAVTSIRSEEFGWVLTQGDDLLCVISHGKLTNRALVAGINNRNR